MGVERQVLFLETNRAGNGVWSMRAAQRLGYRVHFVTADQDDYAWMPDNPVEAADVVTCLNIQSMPALLHFGMRQDPAAVLAFDDDCVILAAILRDTLALRWGPQTQALVTVRFKDRMRAALRETPYSVGYEEVSLARLPPVLSHRRFPCLVKPVDGSGSLGVRVCDSPAAVQEALLLLRERGEGRGVALVEDYVHGDQYSAEMSWDPASAAWRLIGCTKTYTAPGSVPVTLGLIYPSLPQQVSRPELTRQLRDVLAAVGLTRTVVHLEFRIADGVVKVIDVNPRPAGSRIRDLVAAVHHRDVLTDDFLALHLGLPITDPNGDASAADRVAGVWYALPPPGSHIAEVLLPPDWDDPDIVEAGVLGQMPVAVPEAVNADHRVAYVLAVSTSVAETEAILRAAVERIRWR